METSKWFFEGIKAFKTGKIDNPYDKGSTEFIAWQLGYGYGRQIYGWPDDEHRMNDEGDK